MSKYPVLPKKLYLSSPTMHDKEQVFVQEAFDTNWVAPLGRNVDMFESQVAAYVGAKSAAALNAGTAAVHMAVKLAKVQQDDVVLCSDLTFAATVNPVSYENGRQVFIESERESWNMDPRALEKAFQKYDGVHNPKPKAVIVANLYGSPAKLDEIRDICDANCTPLIEDAAESLGATYRGKQTGTFGAWNALSFNGNKIITTSGGGMLLSDDEDAVRKVRFWATQAREPFPYYQHEEIGYNYRMSNIVAGIGRGQMAYLDAHIRQKTDIYKRYESMLEGLPVQVNPYLRESVPNFWLSCLTIDAGEDVTPERIQNALMEHNIESRPIWKPMHMQPVYAGADFVDVGDRVGEDIFGRGLCLPSDNKMTEEEQEIVVGVIRELFE